MINKKLLTLVVFLLPVMVGCQRLTPPFPEEKEASVAQILEAPQEYKEAEVKTSGVLKISKKGLVLEDQEAKIVISTESSKIKAEDFVGQKVELGGILKTQAEETVLELEWIGIVEEEKMKGARVAEKKKESLATFLGVEKEEIKVVSTEEVEWPDTSLGVPEPGMMYAQVVIPGFKIIYQVAGKTYEVHTNFDGKLAVLVKPRTEL